MFPDFPPEKGIKERPPSWSERVSINLSCSKPRKTLHQNPAVSKMYIVHINLFRSDHFTLATCTGCYTSFMYIYIFISISSIYNIYIYIMHHNIFIIKSYIYIVYIYIINIHTRHWIGRHQKTLPGSPDPIDQMFLRLEALRTQCLGSFWGDSWLWNHREVVLFDGGTALI